jgi:hypothetical protein
LTRSASGSLTWFRCLWFLWKELFINYFENNKINCYFFNDTSPIFPTSFSFFGLSFTAWAGV